MTLDDIYAGATEAATVLFALIASLLVVVFVIGLGTASTSVSSWSILRGDHKHITITLFKLFSD